MTKKILALILCILICLSMLPSSAFAEDEIYTVYFWYTSPLTVDESGYRDCLPVGEAMTVDASSDYVIGQVPASILQGLRSYAQSQNLQDHCISYWTVKETGEAFDFVNQRVNETASEDHALNLVATWGTENGHSYGNWHTTQEASCDAPGTKAHTCYICGASESEGIPAAHSIDPEPVPAHPATCTEDGTIAYYECSLCGKRFSDAEGTYELASVVEESTGHDLTYLPETPATCTAEGNTAFYYCEKCGGYFSDENGENQIDAASVVIEINPDAHEWVDGFCKLCGKPDGNNSILLKSAVRGIIATGDECGDKLTCSFSDSNGVLTISGEGEMYEFNNVDNLPPWNTNKDKITRIEIGSGVTSIGSFAFYDCVNVIGISLPDGIEQIGTSAFEGCEKLTGINLPNSIKTIGQYAFKDCKELATITIPGIERLSKYVFQNCFNLSGVTLSNGLKSIGEGAFDSCLALRSLRIPEGTETIESNAFWRCMLKSVIVPDSVQKLDSQAFRGIVSESAGPVGTTCDFQFGWSDSIPDNAFSYTDLKSIVLPEGTTSIGNSAFLQCTSLAGISLPSKVTTIGNRAFSDCTSLSAITVPSGVNSIGEDAFRYCRRLISISLPEGIEEIKSYTFGDCENLETITLPKSLTAVHQNAFSNCKLNTVQYNGTQDQWSSLLPNIAEEGNEPLFRASLSYEEESGTETNPASGTIEGSNGTSLSWNLSESGLLTISGNGVIPAFLADHPAPWPKESIKVLKIGSGITAIGDNSFSGCTNLKYADLSAASSLTSIGAHAFDGVREGIIVGNNYVRSFAAGNNSFTSAEKLSIVGSSSNYVVLCLNTIVPDDQRSAILQSACTALQVTSNQYTSITPFEVVAIDQNGNQVESIPDGITFTLIRQFSTTGSKYGVFHLKTDGTVEKLPVETVDGKLNVTMRSFSPVALVEVENSSSSGASTAPAIESSTPILDNGVTAKGSVTVRNPNHRTVEWTTSSASATKPSESATWTSLPSNTLSNIEDSGIFYYFRYKADSSAGLEASNWVRVMISDYYTIMLTPATDVNGAYNVTGTNVREYRTTTTSKIYSAPAGTRVTVTFTPADHYELYVLSVNNVDKDPAANNPFVINSLNAKTEIKYTFRMSVPIVTGINDVVDNGAWVTGTIEFKTDGREIEYVVQSAKPTSATEWKTLNGTKLADIKTGGTYWYRFKGQPVSKVDSVVIYDYYSVTFAKKGTGKGSYEVLSTDTAKKYENDIYLVRKGDSIRVQFKPDKGWMLYEVDKDGTYVGQANVKETMTFENIRKATKIEYVFSDTARSPKTGDNSQVNLWIAEEILSFLGMTAITWYLFRRKETY